MRSFGHPTPFPSPVGEGADLPTKRRHRRLLLVVAVVASLACGRAHDDAVIPSRTDLAQKSRGVLPGKTYGNREKIRQGMKEAELAAAVGEPSEKLESRGQVVSGHWTYLYADGKIVINLRDGMVTGIETTFY
jgi:hypothetical protein